MEIKVNTTIESVDLSLTAAEAVAFRNFLGGSDVEEIKTDDLLDDMYLLLSRTLEDAS